MKREDSEMKGFQQVEDVWRRFGSLINTGLIVFSALAAIWRGGGYVERIQTDIRTNASEIQRVEREQLAKWEARADADQKRETEGKAIEARYDERIKSVEGDVRKLSGMADNLSYRLTTNEQQQSSMLQTVKEIQSTQSGQGGDLKVIKEILQRLEASQRRRGP
ncbi:gp58-like family protein [Brucella sp. 2716]|uniref:gp58-like family protein n=1 Tax=Brucella sp. 2716 TaxID=2975052 RepID=UPI00217DBDE0|nr:gp58-like family protein [Brucella sp. 2716]UWF60994.1 gp58-like family protein [Brucella sp. 2716]